MITESAGEEYQKATSHDRMPSGKMENFVKDNFQEKK